MKMKLIFPAILCCAIFFAGCEQCTTCNYEFNYKLYDSEGILLIDGTQSAGEDEEHCGKKSVVEDAETDFDAFVENEISGYEDDGYVVTVIQSGCVRE